MDSENPKSSVTPDLKTIFDLPLLDIVITHIAKHLKLKDILTFRECCRDFRDLGDQMLERCPKIELRLAFHREIGSSRVFYDHGALFHLISRKCRKLRILKLQDPINLRAQILYKILQNNPLLQKVSLTLWNSLIFEEIHSTTVNCKNLVQFKMKYCESDFFQHLNLQSNRLLVVALVEMVNPLHQNLDAFFEKQPHLIEISLCGYNIINIRSALNTIARVCRDLQYLNIHECRDIDDAMIMKIAEGCLKIKEIFISENCRRNLSADTKDYLNRKKIVTNRWKNHFLF